MKADSVIRHARDTDQRMWDRAVQHPLQSWGWGEFRRRMGLDTVRLAVSEGETLVDGWQLTFHRVPGTPFTVGYFPKGPMPSEEMLSELIKLGNQKRAIYIQLEPNVQESSKFKVQSSKLMRSHRPLFPKYTFVLDLSKPEEELMAAMHPKTRYNIRLAQKRGVRVAEDNSDESFSAYLTLMQKTTRRQRYYAHSEAYHRHMWMALRGSGIAHLFRASYEGEILTVWIVFVWKDTAYYPYGASSRNNREVMAPNLLLWEIARWAKHKGVRQFDLWGALGPNPDVRDPWYGFHRFKEGYRPHLTEFIGSYDLVINKPAYEIYKIVDALRWIYLKIKKS